MSRQQEFLFSADEVLDDKVTSERELEKKYAGIAQQFSEARAAALANTRYYLSMVNDLDVYVATSMRSRQDFRNMAESCETIFTDTRLRALNLRYFDPTFSAANGHEDKGLIECLMVKCAKSLVYCAGERESYGKDAEAAMALSLGKPVIFYCDQEQRGHFYRNVHPLSRLIEFETGIAVGAMVTDKIEDVSELLYRLFTNKMIYSLKIRKPVFYDLKRILLTPSSDFRQTIGFSQKLFGTTTTKIATDARRQVLARRRQESALGRCAEQRFAGYFNFLCRRR